MQVLITGTFIIIINNLAEVIGPDIFFCYSLIHLTAAGLFQSTNVWNMRLVLCDSGCRNKCIAVCPVLPDLEIETRYCHDVQCRDTETVFYACPMEGYMCTSCCWIMVNNISTADVVHTSMFSIDGQTVPTVSKGLVAKLPRSTARTRSNKTDNPSLLSVSTKSFDLC